MASTDSESSGMYINCTSVKKKKSKSESKHKKKKKDKRKNQKRSRSSSNSIEDYVSKQKVSKVLTSSYRSNVIDDTFGPALPPHLLKLQDVPTTTNSQASSNTTNPQDISITKKSMIGPILPNSVDLASAKIENTVSNKAFINEVQCDIEDNNEELFGPVPVEADMPMSIAQRDLEQRALELKLSAIEGGIHQRNTKEQTVREEWMLELPEVGLKGGLAALSNMKRTFHQGKEKPDFNDRSAWTKTPQTDNNIQTPSTSKINTKTMQEDAQAHYERLRDEEQDRIAKKHKKRDKRDESLVEMHQKKLRKEQKKKEKELAAAGSRPERRPFTRDVDLKLNKIDKNQTKSIVDKAKILNTKFSSGHKKYL